MKLVVISHFSFPEGLAATTRIRAYLKGLKELNVDVESVVLNPTSVLGDTPVFPDKGKTEEGIKYMYPNKRYFEKNKLYKLFSLHVLSWIRVSRYIYKLNKREKIDFLFIANDKLKVLYFYIMLCKFLSIKSIFITDEYPGVIRTQLKSRISSFHKKSYDFILSHVSGMVFMTQALANYYNDKLSKPSHILPSITDISRFQIEKDPKTEEYLCYLGNMELAKDNVNNIIYAFSLISDHYPNINLYLYGAPSVKDKNNIIALIEKLNLTKRVLFKGRVNYNEVPRVLKNAKVLLSSQPNTKRAEGGFPTKLGEYMATGNPVILTDVGEISKNVINRKHVYIVPPEDPTEYSKAISYVLDNYDEALIVGQTGKSFLEQTFGYKNVSKDLFSFLNKL